MRRPGKPNEPGRAAALRPPAVRPRLREEPEVRRADSAARPPLQPIAPARASRSGPVPVPVAAVEEDAEPPVKAAERIRRRGKRLAAGLADLVVHAAVGVLALLGCRGLGVRPELSEAAGLRRLPAVVLFPLHRAPPRLLGAHAGHGLGGHHLPQPRDGEPLTFDQTVRRWLGAMLTSALAGLPLLLAFGGRTLTDWISGSATYPLDEENE